MVPRVLSDGGRTWGVDPVKGSASGPKPGMPLEASGCTSDSGLKKCYEVVHMKDMQAKGRDGYLTTQTSEMEDSLLSTCT